MPHAVVVGLDRLVLEAVGGEAGEKLVETLDAEGQQGAAGPLGVLVDDDPCGVADLPQRLVADDLVGRSPEERREPLQRLRDRSPARR